MDQQKDITEEVGMCMLVLVNYIIPVSLTINHDLFYRPPWSSG